MTWLCMVCGAKAIEFVEYATSKADKNGRYTVRGTAYCERHKHRVKILVDGLEAKQERVQP